MVHQQLKLIFSESKVYIEPTQKDARKDSFLSFDRLKNTFSIESADRVQALSQETISGIIGTIQLNSGIFLVYITKAKKVGQILGNDVFKIEETKMKKISNSRAISQDQEEDDESYISMINHVLEYDGFYFSYTLDVTRNLQSIYGGESKDNLLNLNKSDERFYWNNYLHKHLKSGLKEFPEIEDFMFPIIQGFISINSCNVNNKSFDYILATRRSTRRAGTRYNTRGVDHEGNVANYNETEQIVIIKDPKQIFSYVQTRGSIPIYWKQQTNTKYTPKLIVDHDSQSQESFDKHFEDQIKQYGSQIAVNLVNQKGYELRVSEKFSEAHKSSKFNDQIKLVIFDFHEKCSKSRFHNVKILIDDIEKDLEEQGYFELQGDKVGNKQTSVVRTNCMDCLDRTNVVQTMVARRFLKVQLVKSGIMNEKETIESHKDFDYFLRNVWSDNADIVSKFYSGTGALKTDFTRTGKRTNQGKIMDGVNSVMRYVKNNYTDGFRQDSIDLFLGNFVIQPGAPSPIRIDNPNAMRTALVPFVLFLAIFMILFTLAYSDSKMYYTALWFVLLALALHNFKSNPNDFLSKPKLTNPIEGKKK